MVTENFDIKEKIISVLKQYPIKKAAFFGSYARGDYNSLSDIDLVLDKEPNSSVDILKLLVELEDTSGKIVDIVFFSDLNSDKEVNIYKNFRATVKKEMVWFYAGQTHERAKPWSVTPHPSGDQPPDPKIVVHLNLSFSQFWGQGALPLVGVWGRSPQGFNFFSCVCPGFYG